MNLFEHRESSNGFFSCLVAIFVPQQVKVLFTIARDDHLSMGKLPAGRRPQPLGEPGGLNVMLVPLKWVNLQSLAQPAVSPQRGHGLQFAQILSNFC